MGILIHGHTVGGIPSRTFESWSQMRARCSNPKHRRYPDYGGRGITVCERWSVFENFLADMGERPVGMSIDREDNEGNYEPGNCRWATPTTQPRNRRNTMRMVTAQLIRYMRARGSKLCDIAWAFDVSEATVSRIAHRKTWWTP